jgi:transcriptional regulator with XRE-family HTH domain
MDTNPLKVFRDSRAPPLSQKDLAGLIGVSRETVARWETGARKVDDALLHRVTELTGIPATELRPDLVKLLEPEPTREAAE